MKYIHSTLLAEVVLLFLICLNIPLLQISSYYSGLSFLQNRSSSSNTLSGYSKSIPFYFSFNIFLSSYRKTKSTSNILKKLRSHTSHLISPLFLKLSIDFKYLKPQVLTSKDQTNIKAVISGPVPTTLGETITQVRKRAEHFNAPIVTRTHNI